MERIRMGKTIHGTDEEPDGRSRKSSSQKQDIKSVEYYATDEVPMSQRNVGFFDMIAIWVGANSNNASWYVGGTVAGMAFAGAIGVTLIANPIAYLILALVGFMGFKVGTSTMALTRPAFGIRGSILPTVLNTIVFLGWAVVNTFIAVISISFLLSDLFGWPAYGEPGSAGPMLLGIGVMTALNLGAVSLGRNSIKIVERVGIFLTLFLGLWITIVVLDTHSLTEIANWRPPENAILPTGKAIDIMAAFSLAWVLGVAEFTRFAPPVNTAKIAPMIVSCVALLLFGFVGS